MKRTVFLLLALVSLAAPVWADEAAPLADPQVGDCVIFKEGGSGRILKAPTYWVNGAIAGLSRERRIAQRCPVIGKPSSAYGRDDWVRVAAATPCVQRDADVREVEVLRIKVSVNAWETPWSHQHGTAGWLFRGYFLDIPLKKGEIIDMDASWLERCASGK
jgi:hypothetical protein